MAAVATREIAVPVERIADMAGAALGGLANGAIWRFAPVNAPIAVLITSGLAVGGLMGSLWTRGMPSTVIGGIGSGSMAVLGFVAPLMLGVPTGTTRKGQAGQGESRILNTKALPSPAGERVRERVREVLDLGVA